MKHIYRYLVLCTIFFLLVLPYASVAQENESYSEGFGTAVWRGEYVPLTFVEVRAVKHVNGDWRQSDVHLYSYFDDAWPPRIRNYVDATFTVPEDADWLEVSDDLGWSGLDTQAWVTQRTATCSDIIAECTSETEVCTDRSGGVCTMTTQTVLAEIHLAGWADYPVQDIETREYRYSRHAVFTGTVAIGDHSFSLNGALGENFGDHYSEEGWP